MANIFIAWELGGGLGHVSNLLPLAKHLAARGHAVHVALRDLSLARYFSDLPVEIWQAPFKNSRPQGGVPEPRTFADILCNCGFGEAAELKALVTAWRQLFKASEPALVLAEHSPSALLAAHASDLAAVMLGVGFCCPPAETPCRDLRPWLRKPLEISYQAEQRALANSNHVLTMLKAEPLNSLAELFARVRQTCLLTIPELDPFGPRSTEDYFGAWAHWGGHPPIWPKFPGQQIFAYLKPFPALLQLLALLGELRLPTIVVGDGVDERLQRKHARSWLAFSRARQDMRMAAAECDVAICNANHGTTYALLQAGKPGLYLPLHLEQTLTAQALMQRGLGVAASIRKPEQIAVRLTQLLHDGQLATNCQQLAAHLAAHDPELQQQRLIARIEELLR